MSLGQGGLGLERLDENGKVIDTIWSPTVIKGPDWQYVAAESDARSATKGRVVFSVDGDANLDDVHLSPVCITMIGNKGFEQDASPRRGRPDRLLMWDPVNDDALISNAKRGGETSGSTEFQHEGNRSVRVSPKGGDYWCAIGSLNYGTPGWTNRMRLHGWARCAEGASAQLAANWRDDYGTMVRADVSPEYKGQEWQEIDFIVTEPPTGGGHPVMWHREARHVWFDDFSLTGCRPDTPGIKIFVNQVGYDQDLPKSRRGDELLSDGNPGRQCRTSRQEWECSRPPAVSSVPAGCTLPSRTIGVGTSGAPIFRLSAKLAHIRLLRPLPRHPRPSPAGNPRRS